MKITKTGFFLLDFRLNKNTYNLDFTHEYHIVEFAESDIGKFFDGDQIVKSVYYSAVGPITWNEITLVCDLAVHSINKKLPDGLHNMALMYFLENKQNSVVKRYFEKYG